MGTLRDVSKSNCAVSGHPNLRETEIGCLQRIADATELMALRYRELANGRDYWRRMATSAREERDGFRRQVIAYKATVTRMKRAAAKALP